MNSKILTRSKSDRMIGGVCGGLGTYFNIDAWIIRIIFLILLFNGAGFLLYIILWIALPEEGEKKRHGELKDQLKQGAKELEKDVEDLRTQPKSSVAVGLIVVALGLFLLLNNFLPSVFDFGKLWPLVVILIGVVILTKSTQENKSKE